MSKNVAVFVDVANIFYAAKAAGIDIDYVTLLKSATAGRDFVRAYAYTGLDPENENQRQFHAFLGRSGYKVISKDIRKYGDGRIKANLDIELVVDMMRMGANLDIAVVVSGDGDFAPAIAAVQQMGTRVEVISFRGNTSSDLIDVADVFIDIATVAKVEKGARSGRRVATDGDLSMTEVPDKESGVTPRRRRRRGDDDKVERKPARRPRSGRSTPTEAVVTEADTPDTPDTSAATTAASLVAMPGEKLSRGGESQSEVVTPAEPAKEPEVAAATEEAENGEEGSGRRRRRRRGGRGRGRGGRDEQETEKPAEPASAAAPVEPSATEHPDDVPTLPQHSGFGSVWDTQIGAPPDGGGSTAELEAGDDDFEGEPEVPEYLVAEKKQQNRQRGGRQGGRRAGYRSAIDRERYGGSGFRSGSGGSSGGRSRSNQGNRSSASTPRASSMAMAPIEQTPGGDPWSEVPPEVQALLKAEMARRDTGTEAPATETEAAKPKKAAPKKSTTKEPKKTTTRKKSTTKAADAEPATETEAAKPKKTTTRKKSTTKEPKKTTTRKKSTTKAADAEPASEATEA